MWDVIDNDNVESGGVGGGVVGTWDIRLDWNLFMI